MELDSDFIGLAVAPSVAICDAFDKLSPVADLPGHTSAATGNEEVQSVPRNHGRGVSLIGSLSLRGMVAPFSIEGAVDTLVFDAYVSKLLPQLRRGDIVLLDNLPVHQASQVEAAVATRKAQVLWLPAYSPDFSPLEKSFQGLYI